MNNLNKREKILVSVIIVLAIGLIATFVILTKAQSERNSLYFQNCALQEENNDVNATNLNLLSTLRHEHKIALSADTKLLVADLAWLDSENDTFYMDAFVDMESSEGNCFENLKKLFDDDKAARERAINIVCYHLDNLDLYSVTSEYYDQIAAERAGK